MRDKKTFRVRNYQLPLGKLPEGKRLKLALLADLHGVCCDEGNKGLLQAIRQEKPDAVLLAGDMICRGKPESAYRIELFLYKLGEEFPVFYGMGNHETFRSKEENLWFPDFEERLKKHGIRCLHNVCETITISGTLLCVYGLQLPLKYYQKLYCPKPDLYELTARLGDPDPDRINVLIAHHPMFVREYFLWGADLTVCGHYHGGVWRFTEHLGAISPQFHPFPRYCCGVFTKREQYAAVSPGLGEHSVPLRIHNPRELILLELYGPGIE